MVKAKKNLGKDSAVYEKRDEINEFEQEPIEINYEKTVSAITEENELKEAKIIEKMEERKRKRRLLVEKK